MLSTDLRSYLVCVLIVILAAVGSAQTTFPALSDAQLHHLLDHANKGKIPDQMNLGVRYQYGFSVPRDLAQAEFWLRRAATSGNPPAQVQLGLLYLQPEMLPEHGSDALRWFMRAVAGGQHEAEFNVALIYLRGLGTPANPAQAEHWLRKADGHKVQRAKAVLGVLLLDSPDPARQHEGFELLKQASAQGDPDGGNALAYCYEFGIGTAPDLPAALRLYETAANAGDPDAMHSLSMMYYEGKGVPQDFKRAFDWSQRGCEAGDSAACWSVGTLYAKGEGVPRDVVRGYAYLGVANGNAQALAGMSSSLTAEQMEQASAISQKWNASHAVRLSSLPVYADRAPTQLVTQSAAGK